MSDRGYTLVELVVVVIIIGIIASVAVNSLKHSNEVVRTESTKAELERLSYAIAGNPTSVSGGNRTDYGYVGDIGSLPPNLTALVSNPGGYTTWRGPYISDELSTGGGSSEYNRDAWGSAYTYSAGITISSSGGGSSITRQIANSTSALLDNQVTAVVSDLDFTPPGDTYKDSVRILLTNPNGTGTMTTQTATPDRNGMASFGSVPIGIHALAMVYEPNNDTLSRKIHVNPGENAYAEMQYYANVWTAAGGACSGGGSMVLRPAGPGGASELTTDGCGSNWQCVDEETPDENSTRLERSSHHFAVDYYTLEDPAASGCTITKVTVWARCMRSHTQGGVMLCVFTHSNLYTGADQGLTASWANYSEEWTTNPNTGAAWTWQEIEDLQAGPRMRGQASHFPAYCTQVWVEVTYEP